jgi:hypothetical protein
MITGPFTRTFKEIPLGFVPKESQVFTMNDPRGLSYFYTPKYGTQRGIEVVGAVGAHLVIDTMIEICKPACSYLCMSGRRAVCPLPKVSAVGFYLSFFFSILFWANFSLFFFLSLSSFFLDIFQPSGAIQSWNRLPTR